jgi:peptidoglycan hydrolase-like protein with peptidoglycan-binding domain
MEWRPILCETNITPEIVMSIQQALREKGHNPGPIDGVIGSQTMTAVKSFQREKGLAQGGLTVTTLKELGVKVGDAI